LDNFLEDNSNNLVGLLQDRLKLPWKGNVVGNDDEKGVQGKITAAVREVYEHNPSKIEESIQNWMIRKGYRSADESNGG